MKFNFRKIASVLSSAVMVSSTVALAAAASYPAPFISGGESQVAVVYGSAGSLDLAAVNNLVTSLNSRITPGTTTTTTTTGESFTLQKTSNKFNLNEDLTTIYNKLDSTKLPVMLADNEYEVDDTNYEQKLSLYPLALGWQQDNKFNDKKPFIGFDLSDGTEILNYTLDFDTSVQFETDTELTILGKKYYIAENASDSTEDGGQMSVTLLDASSTQRINEGESLTLTATNGKTYTVTLEVVEEGDTNAEDSATFTVDGETIDSIEAGDSEEIEEGVYLVASDVNYYDSDRTISNAKIALGTGKLFIQDGQEIELNDEALSDTYEDFSIKGYFTNTTASKVKSMTFKWEAADNAWLTKGTDLLMPIFGVKLTMGDLIQGEYEETTFSDGDVLSLETMIKDGELSLPIYHQDDNNAIDVLGNDLDEILVTNLSNATGVNTFYNTTGSAYHLRLDSTKDPMFVLSWTDGAKEGETYALQLTSSNVDYSASTSTTSVKLINLVSSGSDYTMEDIAETVDVGDNIVLTLDEATEDGWVNITVTPSSGTVYTDRVITAAGLTITLPRTIGQNLTFFEEDEDGNLYTSAANFTVVKSSDSTDGITTSGITGLTMHDEEDDSDIEIGYVESDVATKVVFTNPDTGASTTEIFYPGEESYVEVMVAESGATIDGGSAGNIVPIFDTDTIPTDKNLIVVGGSCVNTLAADLLGLPHNSCGNAWQTKTGVGNGQFLIQTFARDNGKVATLVAGYNMEDTANAVNALKTNSDIDISANKKFVGTATSVQAVTVA